MRNYELTCLITSDLPEPELSSLREKIISFLQEEEGSLIETGKLAAKQIFQAKKKNKQALLTTLNFRLEPLKLESLEKKLKSERNIIRYTLLVKEPPKTPGRTREPFKPKTESPLKEEPKVELKEIEKKLEEILEE